MKKLLTILSITLLPIIVSYILISEKGFGNLLSRISALHPFWLLAACVSMFMYWMLETFISYGLLKEFGEKRTMLSLFCNTMTGQFFNSITPFSTGGQPAQIYDLNKRVKINTGLSTSIVMIKFIVFQAVLVAYSTFILIFKLKYFTENVSGFAYITLLGFCMDSAVIVLYVFITRSQALGFKVINFFVRVLSKMRIIKNADNFKAKHTAEIDNFYNCHVILKGRRAIWVKTALLTFLQLNCFFIITYFIYLSFGLRGDMTNLLSSQIFVRMVMIIVPTPGASGAAEGAFYLLNKNLFSAENIALAVMVWRIITFYSCLIIGGAVTALPAMVRAVRKKV